MHQLVRPDFFIMHGANTTRAIAQHTYYSIPFEVTLFINGMKNIREKDRLYVNWTTTRRRHPLATWRSIPKLKTRLSQEIRSASHTLLISPLVPHSRNAHLECQKACITHALQLACAWWESWSGSNFLLLPTSTTTPQNNTYTLFASWENLHIFFPPDALLHMDERGTQTMRMCPTSKREVNRDRAEKGDEGGITKA